MTRGFDTEEMYLFYLTRIGFVNGVTQSSPRTLPGYWTRTPSVAVGFSDMATYNPYYKAQTQVVSASLLSANYQSDGTCVVTPKATLSLLGGTNTWWCNIASFHDGSTQYEGDNYNFYTPTFYQTAISSLSTQIKVNSGSSGLYYNKNGIYAYWRKITVVMEYVSTDGLHASGSVLVYEKQLGFNVDENITFQYGLPTGNYTIRFIFTFTSLARTEDYQRWYVGETIEIGKVDFTLGGATIIYQGAMQMIGVGR